jgi:5'/3'-nucleotidase
VYRSGSLDDLEKTVVSGPQRVLVLTNDDGLEAPGMQALFEAAEGLGKRLVIAPAGPYSGRSHAVTTHEPFRIQPREPGWTAVFGTPADCVRMAVHHLAPEASWILAGINAGGNLGADVFHSGTVAAAREAVLHGKPAIAISQYIARGRPIDWPLATRMAARVLRDLLGRPWQPGTLWNVNLPHPEPGGPEPRVVFCPVDPSPLPLKYDIEGDHVRYVGDYQSRARRPGHDVAVCFGGAIAMSQVWLYPLGETPVETS